MTKKNKPSPPKRGYHLNTKGQDILRKWLKLAELDDFFYGDAEEIDDARQNHLTDAGRAALHIVDIFPGADIIRTPTELEKYETDEILAIMDYITKTNGDG